MFQSYDGYKHILPIIDADVAASLVPEDTVYCYGPSRDLIDQYMPRLSSHIDGHIPEVCPVVESGEYGTLADLFESIWQWQLPYGMTGCSLLYFLAEPGHDLDRGCLQNISGISKEYLRRLPFNLLLSKFQGTQKSICLVEDQSLRNPEIQSLIHNEHKHLQPYFDWENPKSLNKKLRWGGIAESRKLSHLESLHNGFNVPHECCHIHYLDQRNDASLLWFSANGEDHDRGIYFTTKANITQQDALDQAEASQIVSRLHGATGRTDDDNRFPGIDVWLGGDWSSADRPDAIQRELQDLGYPTRTIADVTTRVREVSSEEMVAITANDVILVINGERFGRLPKSPDDLKNDERALIFSCNDPGFLANCLRTKAFQVQLYCNAFGTREEPSVTKATVTRLVVPWPSDEHRKSWRAIQQEVENACESLREELEFAVDGVNGVENSLTDSAWYSGLLVNAGDGLRSAMTQAVDDLIKSLQKQKLITEDREISPPPLSTLSRALLPLPLALLRRRIRNASEPSTRVWLATNLAEMICRMDAVVCVARIRQLAPEIAHGTLTQCLSYSGDGKFAFGTWKHLAKLCREYFAELEERDLHDCDSMILAGHRAFKKLSTKLNALRNERFGHAQLGPDTQTLADADKLIQESNAWLDQSPHLHSSLMFVSQGIATKRGGRVFRRLAMNGIDLEPELQEIAVHQSDPHCDLVDGEVHLLVGDLPISLWPFFIYAGESGQAKKIWFIDEVTDSYVNYRAIDGTAGKLRTTDPLEYVQQFLSH